MESTSNNSISVEIPNYSGTLETLLDLAKNQKVGPEVEDRIALLFARNIEKNLKRLTNRPTIIRM